ncbi:MAG: hypothetical protein ACLFP4_08900 [Spirochaetales bacterium]
MEIIPGLTTTKRDAIPAFFAALRSSERRRIALFPTVLDGAERRELYRALESVEGLHIPHVHLRTDMQVDEIRYLQERFGAELFNIHPAASRHPFGPVPGEIAARVFVENVEVPPTESDLQAVGGMCPDYSHLESARIVGQTEYVEATELLLERYTIGCCHVSAIRPGERNEWNGGPDFHTMRRVRDLDYMRGYRAFLPRRWVSLELENSLAEQEEAVRYLERLLAAPE